MTVRGVRTRVFIVTNAPIDVDASDDDGDAGAGSDVGNVGHNEG